MDLEKAYDRVDREALWNVLKIYGMGEKLMQGISFFFLYRRKLVMNKGVLGEGKVVWIKYLQLKC